jgi:peptidyl-tRNA hydrolase, PTH1 family
MGLFVRRHSDTESQPLYSTVHQHVTLVIGLGNVGKQYDGTRHNIGFVCLDNFADQHEFPKWIEKKDLRAQLTDRVIGDTKVILVKPTTYMNESGQAAMAVQHFYKISNAETVVVHDDLDIAFGQIRARQGGGSAGNNGIKSLIQHLGEDFQRLRIGVRNELLEKIDAADFVLAKFNKDEQAKLPELQREVSALLSEYTASHELPHDTRNFLL